jgi:hypothetical protein
VLGVISAAAVLTDVTGLILAGLALLVVGWRQISRRELADVGLLVLVTWGTVWIFSALLDPRVLLDPTVVLPRPYLEGIAYLARNDTSPGPGYLLGVAWTGGRWWYWPVGLLVKTVPTTLAVLVLGPFGWVGLDRPTRRLAAVVVGLPAVCLGAFILAQPRDIGLRYLLPVIALWLVAASSGVAWMVRSKGGVALVVGSVLVAGAATLASAPESLAYTAPPFPPAYRVLTNADVDWGQGYFVLAQWSVGKDPWVAYFGPRGLGVTDIPGAHDLLAVHPGQVTGWVAVSATDLTSAERTPLAWLRGYCPVGQLDGSILLYRFDQPPVVTTGPSEPAGFCAGDTAGFSVHQGGLR